MSVRANWFVEMPNVTTTADPFAQVESPDPLPERDVLAELRDLILQEGELDEAGITCARKGEMWGLPGCCHDCPLEDAPATMDPLCGLGLAQEELVDVLNGVGAA